MLGLFGSLKTAVPLGKKVFFLLIFYLEVINVVDLNMEVHMDRNSFCLPNIGIKVRYP